MAQKTQLNHVLWVYLLFCWAGIAYAADLSFAEGIESIPLKALGYVAVLSILGGMAATLPKIINPAVIIINVWGEIIKDVIFSLLAGIILFLVAVWWEWPWPQTCLAIILGGAGNAKFIDMVLNNGFFPRVAQALGKNTTAAPPASPPVPREESPQ
jgi:hypothetical protein